MDKMIQDILGKGSRVDRGLRGDGVVEEGIG